MSRTPRRPRACPLPGRARLQAQLEFAARDPAISDAVRVAAWAKIGRVTAEQPEGGGEPILRAPEGWPEGMDPARAMSALLRRGNLI